MEKKENKKKVVYELLTTEQGHFGLGYSFTKEKKIKYFHKELTEDNKLDGKKTKVFICFYLPGDPDKGQDTFFKDYVVSLEFIKDCKEKFDGLYLGESIKKPMHLRFLQSGDLRILTNIAFHKDNNWVWLYEKKDQATSKDYEDPFKK